MSKEVKRTRFYCYATTDSYESGGVLWGYCRCHGYYRIAIA